MTRPLHALAMVAAMAALAACGDKHEGDDVQAADTVPAGAAAPVAPMAGDSVSGATPPVVENGAAVTPANGTGAPMAPGDTAFGNTAPAGPSGPGGQDTLVTRPRP